jgi:hypothetical protein
MLHSKFRGLQVKAVLINPQLIRPEIHILNTPDFPGTTVMNQSI